MNHSVGRHICVRTVGEVEYEDERAARLIGAFQDMTQQRRESPRLLALNGLLNRTGFEQNLERNSLHGAGASLAILCIDLDRFKPVNDQYGHAAGDRVLDVFGVRLVGLVEKADAKLLIAKAAGRDRRELALLHRDRSRPLHTLMPRVGVDLAEVLAPTIASRLQARSTSRVGLGSPDQICTRVPNSTTALLGSRKKSTTPPALRLIAANRRSRQFAMPPPGTGTTVSRLRK
jgi:hypothetical protein